MPARVLIACLLAFWGGCGKQPVSSPSPAEPKTESAAARPADLPAVATTKDSPAEAPDDAQMATILGELTQVVRKFSVERRSVPKNLEELVTNGYLSRAPQAPAGKKFVISKELQVQLVKK
jgi:hypothetical protein